MKLIIGNKNYSSWSLRGWLALTAFDVDFEEVQLSLFSAQFYNTLASYTPVKKVPVLVDGDISVWDSLAIGEYVNENYLDGKAWPAEKAMRAKARSVVAEMHSGYGALRNEMPMNCRAKRKIELSRAAIKDITNIDELWTSLRQENKSKGQYLFGEFSLADVFFAPVVFRFVTYGVSVSHVSSDYVDTMLTHPAMVTWKEQALSEKEIVEEDEAGVEV